MIITMRLRLLRLLFVLCLTLPFSPPNIATATSPLDRYGEISWQNEKARLDNFAIHLTMQPDVIGYFLVRVGKISCRNEAQAHAIRAKNYLMNVRHVPWNRVMWQDVGFGDDFQVTIWLAPRGENISFDYDRPTEKHVVRACRRKRVKLRRAQQMV